MADVGQEQAKRKLTPGCLIGSVLLLAAFIFLTRSSFSPRTYRQDDRLPGEPRTAARPPELGDIITPRPGYPPICLDTKDGLDEAMQWWSKDREEVARAIIKHGGQILKPDQRIKILDFGLIRAKVRVLSTDRECWVVRELIDR
jgi:hypothetical protein